MILSISRGAVFSVSVIGFGSSCRMAVSVASFVSPENGLRPVTIS